MDDDGPLELPPDTLRLLQEFNTEKDAREKQFQDLKSQAESEFADSKSVKLSIDMFGEDWNVSQFWYTDEAASTLARQLLDGATSETCIAVVSAPSVYIQLHNLLCDTAVSERPCVKLFEYDKRFEVVGSDFVFYDFENPFRLSSELKGKFDRIICDPPFLSQDCQTKTALTVRYLTKQWSAAPSGSGIQSGLRLISCTGERMESVILKLYAQVGVKTTTFEPEHSKGLSNEFRCYANFECAEWKWRE